MSVSWIRTPPDRRDNVAALVAAGLVAVGVGAVTFYLTRVFLARESLDGTGLPAPPGRRPRDGTDTAITPGEGGA